MPAPVRARARPAPAAAAQGRSAAPGRAAVPPKPVGGAPAGMTLLPAASSRSSRVSLPGSSRTTIVWMLPAAREIEAVADSLLPAAWIDHVPGLTAMKPVTLANLRFDASLVVPAVTVT